MRCKQIEVKYGGRTIDVENQSDHPRREFYADWNGYAISIQKEKVQIASIGGVA